MIQALHNGTDNVLILDIKVGNIKDCREVLIIYSDCSTGIIGYDSGNDEIFDNFEITE